MTPVDKSGWTSKQPGQPQPMPLTASTERLLRIAGLALFLGISVPRAGWLLWLATQERRTE